MVLGAYVAVACLPLVAGGAVTTRAASATSTPRAAAPRDVASWSGRALYGSLWTEPIPANAPVRPESGRWIDALYKNTAQINVNQGAWTPTIAFADATTPRQRLMMLANAWRLDNVPIPASLQASGDTDAQAIIVDSSTGRAYDFFRLARAPDGSWQAYGGVVFRLGGSGWWDGTYRAHGITGPWAARASGAALGGGLIRPEEVRVGRIDHALAGCAPKYLIGPAIAPASTSDGSGGSAAMPMGTRLQLDPTLDVSKLGLEPGEAMIARALQVYGMYIVESSYVLCIYAQNFSTLGKNPYPASWSTGLSKELIRSMRVVAAPVGVAYDNRVVFGQPYWPCRRSAGYVDAVVKGKRTCLRAGQGCRRSAEREYRRYGLSCRRGKDGVYRLVRRR